MSAITGVQNLRTLAQKDSQEGIREAARQLEAIFSQQLMKSMRATVPKGGMMDAGFAGQLFSEWQDAEFAGLSARSGQLGLAEILAKQLGASSEAQPGPQRIEEDRSALRRFRVSRPGRMKRAYAPKPQSQLPLCGKLLERDPKSLKIAGPQGAPVYAARGGELSLQEGGVSLKHKDGSISHYQGLESEMNSGMQIPRGAFLGRLSGGAEPSLRFHVSQEGRALDPGAWLELKQAPGAWLQHRSLRSEGFSSSNPW